ncbi:MAG: carbon-nitrogen family hydrolase [bacterium]
MKVSLFQMDSKKGDIQSNLIKAEQGAKEAALRGSEIIILPEFWTTGYDLPKIQEYSKDELDSIIDHIASIAKQYNIAIIGTTLQKFNNKIYNTAFLFDKNGSTVAQYNKLHLFRLMDEHKFIEPGNDISVFQTDWGKCGLTICFDLRFPELFRKIAEQGTKIVFIPAYWPAPRLEHWRTLLRARAIENQMFIIGCNRCTLDHKLKFGYSAVIDPEGKTVAEAGTNEILLHAEININKINRIKEKFNLLESRRTDIY